MTEVPRQRNESGYYGTVYCHGSPHIHSSSSFSLISSGQSQGAAFLKHPSLVYNLQLSHPCFMQYHAMILIALFSVMFSISSLTFRSPFEVRPRQRDCNEPLFLPFQVPGQHCSITILRTVFAVVHTVRCIMVHASHPFRNKIHQRCPMRCCSDVRTDHLCLQRVLHTYSPCI